MAIPVMSNISVGSEQLPDPGTAQPNPEAFGSQVAGALNQASGEFGHVAELARHSAIRSMASQAEYATLQSVSKTAFDFSQERGHIDPKKYDAAQAAINDTFNGTLKALPSEEARQQFAANAMRNVRIAMDMVHSHFYTETNKAQAQTDAALVQEKISEPLRYIAANPDKAAAVAEKPQALGWFVGQVMKATGGKANPAAVNEILKAKLGL